MLSIECWGPRGIPGQIMLCVRLAVAALVIGLAAGLQLATSHRPSWHGHRHFRPKPMRNRGALAMDAAAARAPSTPVVGRLYAAALALTFRIGLLDPKADVRVRVAGSGNRAMLRGRISDLSIDVGRASGPWLRCSEGYGLSARGEGNFGLTPALLLAFPWLFLFGWPLPRVLLLPLLFVATFMRLPVGGGTGWTTCRYRWRLYRRTWSRAKSYACCSSR